MLIKCNRGQQEYMSQGSDPALDMWASDSCLGAELSDQDVRDKPRAGWHGNQEGRTPTPGIRMRSF